MGSSTIFVVLALIIWGVSRYMRKSWDMPEEENAVPETEESRDTENTVPVPPVFSYEKADAEEAYVSEPVPAKRPVPMPAGTEDAEFQRKLAVYADMLADKDMLPVEPAVFARKPKEEIAAGAWIRCDFDLKKAVMYSEILHPKYKEY